MQTQYETQGRHETAVHEPLVPVLPQLPQEPATGQSRLVIGLLTGGQDRHYAVGLGMSLMGQNVALEVIGSDEIDGPEFQGNPHVRFLNLHGGQQTASLLTRIARVAISYMRLFRYVLTANPKIFHILWNNKVPVFDRTMLMLFYKLAAKKVVITAHNVNAGRRDRRDSWINRITLRCQYKLADHLFVHTKKMKDELVAEFVVRPDKITIIPYGINNAVPVSDLTKGEARRILGLRGDEKTILCFGAIKQYKGLEILVPAFQKVATSGDYRLIIAGERKKGHEEYWRSIQQSINCHPSREKVLQKTGFIPDAEIEIYFKAADVVVLPYTEIFQSGILFLAYTYGSPVIATDVGSFSEDVVEGVTGFICKPQNPDDLAITIERYFESDLFRELAHRRQEIQDYMLSRHSWETVADLTKDVYLRLLGSVN
jgi:glycosyltransferase involved in cell wall biosynthesis